MYTLIYKIKDGFATRQIAGTWVAVPTGSRAAETGVVVTLSDTAVFLWKLLVEGIQLDDIILKITEEYALDKQTAKNDLDKFLENLKANNLLEVTY